MADNLVTRLRRSFRPTRTLGVGGSEIYGGYLVSNERNSELTGDRRYTTFDELLVNTSIVGAAVRYYQNLVSKASWTARPVDIEDPAAVEAAEFVEDVLDDMDRPWRRVVRRASAYRLYGFSIQEWTAKRREDGKTGFLDVEPRPQRTIERWVPDKKGKIIGVIQDSPQTSEQIPLPRGKLVYIVDDGISDSPEGLGLFRHMVEPATRLQRYLELENIGFETDLRGIPVLRAPLAKLQEMVDEGKISKSDRDAMLQPLRDFITNHIRGPKQGMLMDSQPHTTTDDAERPSVTYEWDLALLNGPGVALESIANAINRINHDLARLFGVEQLLLGSNSTGSFALSRDKTNNFFLMVDSALSDLQESFNRDLIRPLWTMNGFDDALRPKIMPESIQFRDVEQLTDALKKLADAGAPLDVEDPAIDEIRTLMGLSRRTMELIANAVKNKQVVPVTDPEDEDEENGEGDEGVPGDSSSDGPEAES